MSESGVIALTGSYCLCFAGVSALVLSRTLLSLQLKPMHSPRHTLELFVCGMFKWHVQCIRFMPRDCAVAH